MSDLERYLDRVIETRPADSPLATARPESRGLVDAGQLGDQAGQPVQSPNVLAGILRRWYLVLAVFVVLAGIGIPAVWFLVEPGYVVTALIRVAPAMQDILTGKSDTALGGGSYEQFVNTQALSITSPGVIERVVDDLSSKNLTFFKGDPNRPMDKIRKRFDFLLGELGPKDRLKRAISSGTISVGGLRNTELIGVTMKSMRPNEAQKIVDSFVRNYMDVYANGTTKEELDTIRSLEASRKEYQDKIDQANQEIRQFALQGGAVLLGGRQEGGDQRVASLLTELARIESNRISLEIDLQVADPQQVTAQAKRPVDPNDVLLPPMLAARNQYINSDPEVQALTGRILSLEQDLIVAKQNLAAENPSIKPREDLLETFRARLETRRQDIGKQFDNITSEQRKVTAEQQKVQAQQAEQSRLDKLQEKRMETQATIDRLKAHEDYLKRLVTKQEEEVQKMGQAAVNARIAQSQVELDKEMYDTLSRRLKAMDMERKRDPRISVHALADIQGYEDKRMKLMAAMAFGALGAGCLVAFLRDKADKRLRSPDEVSLQLHIPLIGTISASDTRGQALQAEQIAEDFQTIRTNLGLSANGGIPRRLAVTSPGTQEGKTTFAINLATSLAKSGKRVLLVDGDLRKPDVAVLLGISAGARGSSASGGQDGFAYTLCATSSAGLDVLVPVGLAKMDPYEIIASSDLAQRINVLGPNYDHVIIDTPPILAFPDGLIWARIAGSVVLASFMGRTTASDLAEARMRLIQTHARILGTVMNNVKSDQTYNRYRYGYASEHGVSSNHRSQQARRRLLAPIESVARKEGSDKA